MAPLLHRAGSGRASPGFLIDDALTVAGHVDVGSFSRLFDRATDAFRDAVDLGEPYSTTYARGLFVVEAHLTYRSEVLTGETVAVETRLIGVTTKRLHLFHRMLRADGGLAATCEAMLVHVDRQAGHSVAFGPEALDRLYTRCRADRAEPLPAEIGRAVRPIENAVIGEDA